MGARRRSLKRSIQSVERIELRLPAAASQLGEGDYGLVPECNVLLSSAYMMPKTRSVGERVAFTLIEVLVVIAIIGLLVSILIPSLSHAREAAKATVCLSNERLIGVAARLYMDNHRGKMFRHHEGWVLDDGTQLDQLPTSVAGCEGGGSGNSQAEKPWVIFFQEDMGGREVGFCPSDPTERSQKLATKMKDYNGGIQSTDEAPPPDSELALAEAGRLTMVSYLLNSVFTHRSCRYALEHALDGFLIDSRVAALKNKSIIMFSERNSEAMNAAGNEAFGNVGQDDYDTWVGEPALVRWGPDGGPYAKEGDQVESTQGHSQLRL